MAMEYLSIQIAIAINVKMGKPFKLKNHDFEVSHLFFVDDVLLFAKADSLTIQTLAFSFNSTRNEKHHFEFSSNPEHNKLKNLPRLPT